MRGTIIVKVVMLLVVSFVLAGCSEIPTRDNRLDVVQSESIVESKSDESYNEKENSEKQGSENEVIGNVGEDDQKVQYYDNLDNHMNLLYEEFLACNWSEINDTIEEFKKPDEESMTVYATPSDGLFLIIEYMPKVHSWQAYFGEFIDGRKEGMGVMVSKREIGYVSDNVYIGSWNNNLPNGEGILLNSIYDREYVFAGKFVDGKFDSIIQVHELSAPELSVKYVDWEIFYTDGALSYSDITFEEGEPVPAAMNTVEQYIEMSGLTNHELNWLELENDGQYYYRIYDNQYNYVLSVGVKGPADGYRGEINFVYGYSAFFDLNGEEATYGVACYTTNRMG